MSSPSPTTRQRLLRSAERLFAEHGIDAVSMRSICAEADQRNNTALQYHFGDKQGLIEAILAERMSGIHAQRARLLEEMHRLLRGLYAITPETVDLARLLGLVLSAIDGGVWVVEQVLDGL